VTAARSRFLATAFAAGLILIVAAAPTPAAPGVFSLDRLRVGSGSGSENYVFTAADVIVPEGGTDPGTFYKFIVTDAAGVVRNGAFPCTPAASFATTDNSYTVKPTDPVSTKVQWKYTLNQWPTSACSGAAAKTVAKTLNVARASTFADSALATPQATFRAGATAYVTIDGVLGNTDNWSTTWLLPSSATACSNTAGTDRADANAAGDLPKGSGADLQFPPTTATGAGAWNRTVNYDAAPCPALAATNQGGWKLRVELDATHFVVLPAFSVDTTPPAAPSIDAGPSSLSNSSSASFSFSSTEAGVSFL